MCKCYAVAKVHDCVCGFSWVVFSCRVVAQAARLLSSKSKSLEGPSRLFCFISDGILLSALSNPDMLSVWELSRQTNPCTSFCMNLISSIFRGCITGGVYAPCIYTCQPRVTVCNSGLRCCAFVTSFERQFTPLCVHSIFYHFYDVKNRRTNLCC